MAVVTEPEAIPTSKWLHTSELVLDPMPIATPLARLLTRTAMAEWGLIDQAGTIELIVAELVTNAIWASTGDDGRPFYASDGCLARVRLRLSTDLVTTLVEVRDENPWPPTPVLSPNLDVEGGRGLVLVAALSDRWGWDLANHGLGKVVWALTGL